MKAPFVLMLVGAAAALVSCQPPSEKLSGIAGTYAFARSSNKLTPTEAVNMGYWDVPQGLEGPRSIVIDTKLQTAKYYIGGTQVGMTSISTGKEGKDTPIGTFKVLAKDANHKSSSYGSVVDAAGNTLISDYKAGQPMPAGGRYKGADMNNALQLTTTGIWMHEGIVTAAPESHGCIRLPKKMAKLFFDNTPVGTPVIIK